MGGLSNGFPRKIESLHEMLVARSLEKIVASNKPTQRNHHPQPFGRDIATDLYGWINPDTFIPQLQTSMSGFLDENFLQKNPVIPVIQPMAIEKPETRSDLFSPFFALYHITFQPFM